MIDHLGSIEFSGEKIAYDARYDRIAIDANGHLLLVSIVAETQKIKAIAAILNKGAKARVTAAGGEVGVPGCRKDALRNPGICSPTEENYARYLHRLDYGLAHAMFVSRMPGFMPVANDEALWQELMDVRFTTPLLRSWLPYVQTRLKALNLLQPCLSFNVQCAVLIATTKNLDDIVCEGIRTGAITIPRTETASCSVA